MQLGRGEVQVKVNPEVKGIIVKGANVLPTRLIEDLFRQQYGKPLKYPLCTAAVQGINAWYENQGYVGQVETRPLLFLCIAFIRTQSCCSTPGYKCVVRTTELT